MKQFLTAIFTSISFLIFAQETLPLKAYLSYSTFNSPNTGPFIETYLSVVGNTVVYKKNENNKLQGEIEVLLVFKDGEEIKNYKKYNLLSPEFEDSTQYFSNFIDQQRFVLPNGIYNFEIKIADKNSDKEPFKYLQVVPVNLSNDSVEISDIQLIESFKKSEKESIITKSGYDLIPYVSDFYPEEINKLKFYTEIYNTDKQLESGEKYLLNYYIESYESGIKSEEHIRYARQTSAPVNVLLNEFDISKLPSGNYNLVVELKNKTNELIASKSQFFYRSNPSVKIDAQDYINLAIQNTFVGDMTNEDSLTTFISFLYPIASELENNFIDNQLKDADLELKQKFFLSFWKQRNNFEPEIEWIKYKREVNKVNNEFSTTAIEGYRTDRGRVYLQYGPPNTRVVRENEPSSYPYEIWHYYTIKGGRSNVKFVFYSTNLSTNLYELLHSNLIGERNNYKWRMMLEIRNNPNINLDQTNPVDNWGTRTDDYFDIPR